MSHRFRRPKRTFRCLHLLRSSLKRRWRRVRPRHRRKRLRLPPPRRRNRPRRPNRRRRPRLPPHRRREQIVRCSVRWSSVQRMRRVTTGSVKPAYLSAVQSIAVPTFKNQTLEPRIESLVTGTVIKQFQQDGTYRIASEDNADAILKAKSFESAVSRRVPFAEMFWPRRNSLCPSAFATNWLIAMGKLLQRRRKPSARPASLWDRTWLPMKDRRFHWRQKKRLFTSSAN